MFVVVNVVIVVVVVGSGVVSDADVGVVVIDDVIRSWSNVFLSI